MKRGKFSTSQIDVHVGELFPGMNAEGCYQFRVTRNSNLYVDEDCSWGSGEKKACAETLECDPRWVSKLLSKGMRLLRTHIRDLRDERRVR